MKPTSFILFLFGSLFLNAANAATFPSWQSTRFTPAQLSNPSVSGLSANPDNDSFANLAEYAFALEPFTANSTREALGISLFNPSNPVNPVQNSLLFTYVQRKDATDLLYQIEYTDDITQPLWNLLTNPQEPTAALDLGPVWQRTIAVPPHFTSREFLRLRLHQSTSPVILNDPPQQLYLRLHEPFVDIDLRWVDRSNQETGYRIERRADNTSSWTYVGTTDYDARYFRDVHLASDTLYHYRARAVLYDGSFGVSSSEKTLRTPLDSDGDNLPDWFELKIGTSISNADSDGDGLSDAYEVSSGTRSYGYADIGNGQKETLPQPIEDLDGNPTGEMTNGAPDDPYFNPSNGDSDNNGIDDGEEDFDTDGLTNSEESELGTDPNTNDTDADSLLDGEEAAPLDAQILLPRVPENHYAIVPIKELAESAFNQVFAWVNDKGQFAWNEDQNEVYGGSKSYFWEPGAVFTEILPDTDHKNYVVDLSDAGKVLLRNYPTNPNSNASSYFPNRKLYGYPSIWTKSAGMSSLKQIASTTLVNQLDTKTNPLWQQLQNTHRQKVQTQIDNYNNALSNTTNPVDANTRTAIEKSLQNLQGYKAALPSVFNLATYTASSFTVEVGSASLGPIAFNQDGNVLCEFAEDAYVGANESGVAGFSRNTWAHAVWAGNDASIISLPNSDGKPASGYINFYIGLDGYASLQAQELSAYNYFFHYNHSGQGVVLSGYPYEGNTGTAVILDGKYERLPKALNAAHIANIPTSLGGPLILGFESSGDTAGQSNIYVKENNAWRKWKTNSRILSDPERALSNRLEILQSVEGSIWRNGKSVYVPDLLDGAKGMELFSLNAISPNSGLIAATMWKTLDTAGNTIPQEDQKQWLSLLVPYEIITRGETAHHPVDLDQNESVSNPIPEVDLTLTEAKITTAGKLQISFSGTVEDPLSETLDNPSQRVQNLVFSANGTELGRIDNLPSLSPGQGEMPWQPYLLKNSFQKVYEVPLDTSKSMFTLRAASSANAVGNRGWDEIVVWVDWVQEKQTLASNEIPGFTFTTTPSPTASDSLTVKYNGVSAGTLQEISGSPASLVFRGDLTIPNLGTVTSQLRIFGPLTWTNTQIDQLAAQLEYQKPDGTSSVLNWRWDETAANTLTFQALSGISRTNARPVIAAKGKGNRSPHGSYTPFLLRLDGTEAFFQNPQTKFSLNGVEKPLQGFSFSPKRYYIPTNDASRPQIYVVTTDALPASAPTILPPGVTVIAPQDPAMKYKIKFGTEEHEVASMELYDDTGLVASTVDETPPPALTQDKLMGFYRLFFGAEGIRLLGLHNAAQTSITVENRSWYQLGYGGPGYANIYRPGNLPPQIVLYDDVDPVTGATFLYDSLKECLNGNNSAVSSLLVNYYMDSGDAATKLTQARQMFVNTLAVNADNAAEAAKFVVSIVNDGADLVITVGDYHDGKVGAGTILLTALPFVTGSEAKLIVKKGGQIVSELPANAKAAMGNVLAAFRKAPARVKDLDFVRRGEVLKKLNEGLQAGQWTEQEMRKHIKFLQEADKNVLFSIAEKKAGSSASSRLKGNMALAGKMKPMVTGVEYQAHHYLPVQFDNFFMSYGFDINAAEYGEWLDITKHRLYHRGVEIPGKGKVKFNDFWLEFRDLAPANGYSRQQILDKLAEAKQYYPYQ